ncbi:MAG: glycosyltransferase, partial [Actinomycetota bacterium]|nr:glycosyltransferase [Actinomycetota bacterium]
AEQLLASSAPYYARDRFDYEAAYLLPDKVGLVDELVQAGVPVRCLEGARGMSWTVRLRTLVREHDIDLVHVHSPYAAIGARLALPRPGGPRIVYTEHAPWDYYKRPTYWGNLLTFHHNDHVFAVSDYVRAAIRMPSALRSLSLPPIETLYHGLDPSAVQTWGSGDGVREELGIPDDAPVVGTVANFRPQKRYDLLLHAAARVLRTVPGARFILVGQGPLEAQTRRLAHRLGLEASVVFAGYRDDVPRVARTFDVFVLASGYEGLSIALIEAMMLSRPCVVTRVGGVSEVVEHGRNALVANPDDPVDLAACVTTLLRDRALAARLGAEARLRAADFQIPNAVRRQEQVYGELLLAAPGGVTGGSPADHRAGGRPTQ